MNTLKKIIGLAIVMCALITSGCAQYEKQTATNINKTDVVGITENLDEAHTVTFLDSQESSDEE